MKLAFRSVNGHFGSKYRLHQQQKLTIVKKTKQRKVHELWKQRYVVIVREIEINYSLNTILMQTGKVRENLCKLLMRQLLEGLSYMNQQGMMHDTIGLTNIHLKASHHLQIGNFKHPRKSSSFTLASLEKSVILARREPLIVNNSWLMFSIGSLMYTLLIGRSPYDFVVSQPSQNIIMIRKNDRRLYQLHRKSVEMINSMLLPFPNCATSLNELLNDPFLVHGHFPVEPEEQSESMESKILRFCFELKVLFRMRKGLCRVVMDNPDESMSNIELLPSFFVSKWILINDSEFGYSLNDESVGAVFHDKTRMILANDEKCRYISAGRDQMFSDNMELSRARQQKKKTLLKSQKYMKQHLKGLKAPQQSIVADKHILGLPYVFEWVVANNQTLFMILSDGTFQANFKNHEKVIICTTKRSISFVDAQNQFLCFSYETIIEHGIGYQLWKKINEVLKLIDYVERTFDVSFAREMFQSSM